MERLSSVAIVTEQNLNFPKTRKDGAAQFSMGTDL